MEQEFEKLKKEKEELMQMNEVKSDLISISAHQLRTSLSALKWILKMFLEKDLGEITFEQESFIKRALINSERMTTLVNDLLTLNHSEDNKIKFNFKKINILEIIEQTIFEFSGETKKKNVEIIFIKPETITPPIEGDEEMVRVVIQNLLENSIKYSFKDHKIFIALKYNEKNKNVEISIRDNGIGIKESDKENIFNKFFRAENATEKDPLGSGLGLFTTKNIIERHHGKIWFESTPGSGTTFFITIPTNTKQEINSK